MRLTILLLAAVFLASACAVGPDYVRPDPPLPAGWQTDPAGFEVVAGAQVGRWWDAFGDPELSLLVERAVAANKDLVLATARVAEAQSLYKATRSAEFPSIDSDAGVDYERSSVNALFPGGNDATVFKGQTVRLLGVDSDFRYGYDAANQQMPAQVALGDQPHRERAVYADWSTVTVAVPIRSEDGVVGTVSITASSSTMSSTPMTRCASPATATPYASQPALRPIVSTR